MTRFVVYLDSPGVGHERGARFDVGAFDAQDRDAAIECARTKLRCAGDPHADWSKWYVRRKREGK